MKRTEITIETKQRLVIRQSRCAAPAWCDQCGEPVQMLSAEAAAGLAGVRRRAIYAWVESNNVHFAETPDGRLLICPNSFSSYLATKTPGRDGEPPT